MNFIRESPPRCLADMNLCSQDSPRAVRSVAQKPGSNTRMTFLGILKFTPIFRKTNPFTIHVDAYIQKYISHGDHVKSRGFSLPFSRLSRPPSSSNRAEASCCEASFTSRGGCDAYGMTPMVLGIPLKEAVRGWFFLG